ncbi:MAG: cation diffusion facilitator family transporter [Thermomicrobiales bacterium]
MTQQALPRKTHSHGAGPLGWLGTIFHFYGHGHEDEERDDDPLLSTDEGIRVVWVAFAMLTVTTIIQIAIVSLSGSVALLADAIHNVGDSLNSIPLLIAFSLARRRATRRYTYGYGRAEDVAGVIIVLSIAFSAAYILWESFVRLLHPRPMQHIPWVVAAAIIGFLGNEAVALLQIRAGRRMGSAAMIADGLHARIDGLTSLAVLIAAAGTVLGFPIVDPIIGLLMGVSIVFITKDAAVRIWQRLMDGVDPLIVDRIEQYAGDARGVEAVESIHVRWLGHRLHAEVGIALSGDLTVWEGIGVTDAVRRALLTNVRHLSSVAVEIEPQRTADTSGGAYRPASADGALSFLPARYQDPTLKVSAAPMGAAALEYDTEGNVAWDEIWTGYCELALAGGPPHRGTLLEPVSPDMIAAKPERYEAVLRELERGLTMVTGLPVRRSDAPGWIGLECESEEMALWLLRAIIVENVMVRREDTVLWFPAGPDFRVEREIKNVITVVAKTNHYWQEHARTLAR